MPWPTLPGARGAAGPLSVPDATGGDEFEVIGRIAARVGPAPPGEVWIGDDAALVRVGHALLAVAADALVVGVHADLALTSVADLGWKALAVNVSDLAAMGCIAERALVTVSGPPGTDLDGLYDGLAQAPDAHALPDHRRWRPHRRGWSGRERLGHRGRQRGPPAGPALRGPAR